MQALGVYVHMLEGPHEPRQQARKSMRAFQPRKRKALAPDGVDLELKTSRGKYSAATDKARAKW